MADDLNGLLAASSFSFVGTVTHLNAATMADIPVDDRTAVVSVDHVLHAPDAFAQMEGHQITVQLAANQNPPALGDSMAFFAQGLAFGDSVAVTEIGRLPVDAVEPHATAAMAAGKTAGAFDDLLEAKRQADLRAHSADADAAVVGRVVGIRKAGPSRPSEHDPDWWIATISVFHVEKGNVPGPTVDVLFANSLDVRWIRSPKPKASQGGLWLLHATSGDLAAMAPFEIPHPEDVQPTQQLDVLRGSGE